MNNRGLIIFGLIMAGAVVFSVAIGARVFYQVKNLENTISVTGSSERIIRSDTVKWRSTFNRNTGIDTLKDGYGELKKDLERVVAYLHQNKIEDKHITINSVSVYPVYQPSSFGSGPIIGYTLSQQVIVESNEVEKVAKAAQGSGNLLNQGIIFTSDPLEYYYSKLNDLKVEMLGEATANAKARAEQIAKNSGTTVGAIRSASVGVFQVTSVHSTEISDYGVYDTSALEKRVTGIVRASFSLK